MIERMTRPILAWTCALAASAGSLSANGALAQPSACVVEEVRGAGGDLLRDGAEIALIEGLPIRRDDVVETHADGRATIACDWGPRVVIGTETRVELEGIVTASDRPGPVMSLIRGAAGFLMELTDGLRFEVRTPTAVAAVRSTEWALIVENLATAAFVREGVVQVRAGGGTVRLEPGEGVDVRTGGAIGPVVEWGAPRIEALAERLGPGWTE